VRPTLALSGPVVGLAVVLSLFVLLIGLKGGAAELGKFAGLRNVQVLVQEGTVRGVVALGMLLIIISGGIDLSVGSVVALVTVVTMQVYRLQFHQTHSQAWATLAAVPAGIAVGGLCGLINGLVITRLRVTPFVATLGMYGIARGLAYWVSGRTQLAFPRNGRPHWVDLLADVHPSGTLFNPGFWGLVALAVAAAVLLRYTVLGRYCYAIGSNEAASRLCGIAIERYKVVIYTLAGVLTGWAGILLFARLGAGDPSCGKELELDVIAAVVIGGASLMGGQGTVTGALLGVLILEVLRNGVNTFEVPVEVQYILMGAIIIANTALSHWRRRLDIKV
jgi:ribose transport system permease protein